MRILCLTKYDQLGASSRLRFMQYLPFLTSHGFKVEVRPLFGESYINAVYLNKPRAFHAVKSIFDRYCALRDIKDFDMVWIEGEIFPWLPWCFENILWPRNIPIIVDYDDAIFHNYDLHKRWPVRQLLGSKIDHVMKIATSVVVGNDYLAGRARSAGSRRIEIVPTVVDSFVYTFFPIEHTGPITVGWIGSPSTWAAYLEPLLPSIESFVGRLGARLLAIGAYIDNRSSLEFVDFEKWSEDSEVSHIQRMDIGIMPLADTPWAQGKCGYKLIQYMACGLPVIASPVGVNSKIVEHGINGFLAETEEDWVRALEILINDRELRDRMGKAGRERVENTYSLQIQAPRLTQIFESVAGNAPSRLYE